jgi:anti-sigma factor RsiW
MRGNLLFVAIVTCGGIGFAALAVRTAGECADVFNTAQRCQQELEAWRALADKQRSATPDDDTSLVALAAKPEVQEALMQLVAAKKTHTELVRRYRVYCQLSGLFFVTALVGGLMYGWSRRAARKLDAQLASVPDPPTRPRW